jgi:hypothetical protein
MGFRSWELEAVRHVASRWPLMSRSAARIASCEERVNREFVSDERGSEAGWPGRELCCE